MINNAEPVVPPPVFQDRKTLLVVFGILQIFLGAICALMAPLTMVSLAVSKFVPNKAVPPTNAGMLLPTFCFYIVAAVWFVWMGIGSIKARRWARALILTSSWLWLIIGIIVMVFMIVYLPNMFAKMPETKQMPQAFFIVMKIVMAIFMLILYVVIPGIFVLVYRRENIKRTCEFYDREMRWTDRCPLPVLALVLLFGAGAFSFLLMLFYKGLFPFFGTLVQGWPGVAIVLALAALFAYISRGMCRLDIKVWWLAVITIILIGVSTIVTFLRISIWDLYAAMGYSEQQVELIKQYGFTTNAFKLFGSFWCLPVLGYLIYLRKYFRRGYLKNAIFEN
jgi:MFS family permease